MAARGFLVSFLLCCLAVACHGASLSSLDQSLVITASPTHGQVLKAGEDNMTVTWSFNKTFGAGKDSAYKTVKVKLCYAPISQQDRAWRKTEDNLEKDKTCQHTFVTRPYNPAVATNTYTGAVERDVPGATYFLRAYAYDSHGHEAAYGQNTDAGRTTDLFVVQAITGRHVSLDIASVCFSAFSVVSLFGFFYLEKRKGKASQKN